MSKPVKKSTFKWSDKAKQDALGKFAREAERLLNGGLSLDDMKKACDSAASNLSAPKS
jgi:hypothetical protein